VERTSENFEDRIVRTLTQYLFSFVPRTYYRWGGACPLSGVDCSGLIISGLQAIGLAGKSWDTTAAGLYIHFTTDIRGQAVQYPREGDFAFYGKSGPAATHVGYCMDDYFLIEAGGGDRHCTDEATAARKNAYVRLRPITYRDDLVGFARPNYSVLRSKLLA
jgi:hypothetical protein